MKTTIQKGNLVKYLSYTDAIASSKSTIPILTNILLDANNGTLSFLSSNLETGIKITDTANILENGALAVNGKKLLSIVRELPEADVDLSTDEHNRLMVKSMSDQIKAKFTMAGVAKDEFPEVKTEPDNDYITINADEFKEMIKKVIFSISSDENKYSLTGIFFEKDDNGINMVATDGKRLAMVTKTGEKLELSIDDLQIPHDGVIVPKIVFTELLKYPFEQNKLSMGFSKNQIFFMYDNIRLTSNLIEGKYPEYKRIIPVEREKYFIADKTLLLNAIKRVSVLVDESFNQIKLSLSGNTLVLSCQNPSLGGAVEEIPIQYSGDEIDIALNYIYLIDCVKEISSENIKIDFENAERVINVYGEDEEGYINLIMPMKITL